MALRDFLHQKILFALLDMFRTKLALVLMGLPGQIAVSKNTKLIQTCQSKLILPGNAHGRLVILRAKCGTCKPVSGCTPSQDGKACRIQRSLNHNWERELHKWIVYSVEAM